MKTVALFCPATTWGGVEKNVLVRAKFLSQKKHQVYVILLKGFFEEKFDAIPNVTTISVLKRGGDINISVIYNYVKILKKIKPHTVFVASKKDWFLVSLSSKIAKINKVVLYLGIKRKIKTNAKYKFVFNYLKPTTLVNSDSLKEYLLKSTPFFNQNNLYRVYNGFNIPVIDKSIKSKTLKKLNLDPNAILIGCAGRFSPQKGFDLLPKIIQHLPENVHIIHAGGQGNQEKSIKELIKSSSTANRVHFMGQLKNMNSFYNSLDLFLLCSRWEGMANVLNEALSYGLPCISTKVDGSLELLDYGKYAFLQKLTMLSK